MEFNDAIFMIGELYYRLRNREKVIEQLQEVIADRDEEISKLKEGRAENA
jgi:hypothetical protein